MKKKEKRFALLGMVLATGLAIPTVAQAGFWELTMFSRASCQGISESISWDLWEQWEIGTEITWVSPTQYGWDEDVLDNIEVLRRRSRVACSGSSCSGIYQVDGCHYATDLDNNNQRSNSKDEYLMSYCPEYIASGLLPSSPCKPSVATDCNLGEW